MPDPEPLPTQPLEMAHALESVCHSCPSIGGETKANIGEGIYPRAHSQVSDSSQKHLKGEAQTQQRRCPEKGVWRGNRDEAGAKCQGPHRVSPPHLQSGMDDLLHRGEVGVPQKLGLLTQDEDPRGGHLLEGSQDLGHTGRKGEVMEPCQALTDPGWGQPGNQKPSPIVLQMGQKQPPLATSQVT